MEIGREETQLERYDRNLVAALLCTLLASILLIAPTVIHRAVLAFSMIWFVLPLLRRRAIARRNRLRSGGRPGLRGARLGAPRSQRTLIQLPHRLATRRVEH